MAFYEGSRARGGPPGELDIFEGIDALPPANLTLEQVHLYSRHGERTPVLPDSIPSMAGRTWQMCGFREGVATVLDLVGGKRIEEGLPQVRIAKQTAIDGQARERVQGPQECLAGELTDLGRQSTLKLGRALRRLYVDRLGLLPSSLPEGSDAIQLRSTDLPRTIQSLQQIFYGLFPPSSHSPAFTPVIELRESSDEGQQFPVGRCARLAALQASFAKAAATRFNVELLKPLDDRLRPYLHEPMRIDGRYRAVFVADVAQVAHAHDVPAPDIFADPAVSQPIEQAIIHEWFDGYQDKQFKRLAAGRMTNDLLLKLDSKVQDRSKDPLKLALNSCHDTTIGAWLAVFDRIRHWPTFTSHIAIELFSRPSSSILRSFTGSRDFFVRVRYQGEALRLPACAAAGSHLDGSDGKICTYDAFRRVLQDVAMSKADWQKACVVPKEKRSDDAVKDDALEPVKKAMTG